MGWRDSILLASESTYLIRNAVISGYRPQQEHKMAIFLIPDGLNWAARSFQTYFYKGGFWSQTDGFCVRFGDSLTALESLFAKISGGMPKWGGVTLGALSLGT